MTGIKETQLKHPEIFIPGVAPFIASGVDFGKQMKDNPSFKWNRKPIPWNVITTFDERSQVLAKEWTLEFSQVFFGSFFYLYILRW